MLAKLKRIVKSNKLISAIIVPAYRTVRSICRIPKQIQLYLSTRDAICADRTGKRVYYIGIPAHNNLGDLAQGVCIRKWLRKNLPDREIVEIETNALVNTYFSVKKHLKANYHKEDIIVFQSGYTTTDLGGYADEMHCTVIKLLPDAKILMMPQTVFFASEERKKNTSAVYSSAKNMMFLARDRVSFASAEEMFPTIPVLLYPDIVTTLIGNYRFDGVREGILFCCRDDSEKYYSDEQLGELMNKLAEYEKVSRTDTTKSVKTAQIVKNAEAYILAEIERYSHYKVIITDRYHGTIFSLIAGTPVVILKTTDHKVTTGAEWFRGIYDSSVHCADSLDSAYEIVKKILSENISHTLEPYFEKAYYDKLIPRFTEVILNTDGENGN